MEIIEIKKSIYEDNDAEADRLRERLAEEGIFLLNLMSSPGAGKTSILSCMVKALRDEMSIGIMEADIDSDVDAKKLAECGVEAIQLHTGGMCHLDAGMTAEGLLHLKKKHELVVLENVGNLVCPAEFDTGASANAMILSVPEGDDKPLKYPLMFEVCSLVLINKTDTMSVFDFDMEKAKSNILMRNPDAKIIPVSAKTGEGMEDFFAWIREQVLSR